MSNIAQLGRYSWPEAKYSLKNAKVVLLPLGGLQQHGPHLPLETDNILVGYYGNRVGERVHPYCAVAPVIPYNIGLGFENYTGSINLSEETYSLMLRDMIKGFKKDGIEKFVIISVHNNNRTRELTDKVAQELGTYIEIMDVWEMFDEDDILESGKGHAGEFETSQMLYISPESVRRDRMDVEDGALGVKGKPILANEKKGEAIVEYLVEKMVSKVEELLLRG
ncbi:hypothetical protein B6U74_02915 [Candidatus Bathyarchaeota archaeon ex4484_205]|nr:MAG: hypothetical protein B6U74_02915 [Candidatus Bathyarchaeota archaeon ex4484_205]